MYKKNDCTIFYSWQSDIKESRNFISDCLEKLEKRLSHLMLCNIDRDTKGLAGAPDIGDSIYEKIDVADIFIADVTIINKDFQGRKTPNPNVMIELGYAIKALGWDRIILLYNRDYGDVEELPFDINHRRMTAYSLSEQKKAEVRENIVSNIQATIHILEQEHRLYGGTFETVEARITLSQLIKTGLIKIWNGYYEKYVLEQTECYENLIPVSETQIGLVEVIKRELTEEQYQLLHSILFHMKMSTMGNDEMCGWEFAEKLVSNCFEALYVEYIGKIAILPYEKVLQEKVVELINVLSLGNLIEYEKKRVHNGKIVFSCEEENFCAYDINGNVLCNGTMGENGFTGYKSTEEYEGNYSEGKRDGYGCEFCFTASEVNSRYKIREGLWQSDCFMEGTVYGVLMYKKKGVLKHVLGGTGGIITRDCWEFRLIEETPEEEQYFYADMKYVNGEYEVIEDSVRNKPMG